MNLDALQNISYGMYVVGSHKGDKLNCQIAIAIFQITSEPPKIVAGINKEHLTHEYIRVSKVFAASVLIESTPLPFIMGFGYRSGREADKLKDVRYKLGQTGSPIILDNTNAYFEAEVIKEIDAGTHTMFLANVVAAEIFNEEPCLLYEYYQQVKQGLTPKTCPCYIPKN
jgi:ferric-chelate reductase [NAD(P)H]